MIQLKNKGSSINQVVMSPIYDYVNKNESGPKCLGITIFIASITVVLSSLCAFLLIYLDRRRCNFVKKHSPASSSSKEKMKLKDALSFPIQLWLMIVICIVFYSATFPFISLAKLFFIRKYNASTAIATLQQR
jgi:hypothetical protein